MENAFCIASKNKRKKNRLIDFELFLGWIKGLNFYAFKMRHFLQELNVEFVAKKNYYDFLLSNNHIADLFICFVFVVFLFSLSYFLNFTT